MTLYLDCEFNGFHGELISMALVSSETGKSWYRRLPDPDKVHPWVLEHVMPLLGIAPDPPSVFRASLWQFLKYHENEIVVADWPEDFAHLMQWLCEPNGVAPRLELTLQLIHSGELKPEVPHNALSDARALMEWHITQ